MNVCLPRAVLCLVTGFCVTQAYAAKNDQFDHTTPFLGVSLGSSSADANYDLSAGEMEADMDDSFAPSLTWGVQRAQARFAFEYYQADFDINNFNASGQVATDEYKALFYSGYWIPPIIDNLRGIVGAGIGYGYQKIEGGDFSRMEDANFTYKFTLGLEYYVFPKLSISGVFESIYTHDAEDKARLADAEVAVDFIDFEQQRFALGVNYYLD